MLTENNRFQAFASLLCPGLGQLLQGRVVAFFWYFAAFVISALIPIVNFGYMFSQERFTCFHLVYPYFWFLVPFPVLVIFSSTYDAITWNPNAINSQRDGKRFACVGLACLYLVLVLMIVPVFTAREAARRMQCSGHLSQIKCALLNYHDSYGSLPPAFTVDVDGKPLHSWRVLILPFINEENLYNKIRLNEPWDSIYNKQFHSEFNDRSFFKCPTSSGSGCIINTLAQQYPLLDENRNCSYSVIVGEETAFPGSKTVSLKGWMYNNSNTILVAERMIPICWMDPTQEITFEIARRGINCELAGLGSPHPLDGCFVMNVNNGYKYITNETTPPKELEKMLKINKVFPAD
ncbi:MAG: DUF1559 domain-containing protein [Thermoguttaceae bacterium]